MRTDIDAIVSKVEADGVCVVPDFIPRDLLTRIRNAVDQLNAAERESGSGFLESEGVNQRVFNLVNKGEVFEQIVQHEDVMAAMNASYGAAVAVATGPASYRMLDSHPQYRPDFVMRSMGELIGLLERLKSEKGEDG